MSNGNTHVDPGDLGDAGRVDPNPPLTGGGSGNGGDAAGGCSGVFWRGIIVGVALGLWVASLALWALWTEDDRNPACQTACCSNCNETSRHAHPPPVNHVWAPPGPLRYYCGVSDHGGSFLWDHGGGSLWDHGGGYLWDHGGGYVWDHGGGFVWDHGGGYVWDHGGSFVWDSDGGFRWRASGVSSGPALNSPKVPVPAVLTEAEVAAGVMQELTEPRDEFEYRCTSGPDGQSDVAVLKDNLKVSIVMPEGNLKWQCVVKNGEAALEEREIDLPGGDTTRRYCMVVGGAPREIEEPAWVN